MDASTTYTVEAINSAFTGRVPWGDSGTVVHDGLTQHQAIKLYKGYYRDYNPQSGGWCGHVRIVGSDNWTYQVQSPEPGERASLSRLYHLDDI
jgi:hypothetical protein